MASVASSSAALSPAERRALVRRYKETPPPMGVFAVRNLVDRRAWVGASMNLAGALHRARFELQQRAHRVAALQADWTRLGAQAFAFEVVDTLKPQDDPAHDYRAELDALLALWTEEFGRRGELGYQAGAAR